jgi:Fic family protein
MEKPPFKITPKVLSMVSQIQEIIGELKAQTLVKPSVKLRRENKIKTVHHSLAIEGNSLTEEQITALLEKKRVVGPKNQITEVLNALELYDRLVEFDPFKEKDLLKAHSILLKGLGKSGQYRSGAVGVFKGSQVGHMAPPPKQVPRLMQGLFHFVSKDKEAHGLIKACVFHYELEFIHPFEDGNGRMGRLWQQLLLMKQSPIFEFISVETLIHKKQSQYYKVLEQCDRVGDSTAFVEFSLELILKSLENFRKEFCPGKPKITDRIEFALKHFMTKEFSRKEYLHLLPGLSTATASRDLAQAVSDEILIKTGEKALARYRRK